MISANKPALPFPRQSETSRTIQPNHLEKYSAQKRTDWTLFPAVRVYKLIDFSDSVWVSTIYLKVL